MSNEAMEAADRVREIAEEIADLIHEAKSITRKHIKSQYEGFDVYVFRQINEHVQKGNPYNQDLQDVADALEAMGDEENDEENEDEVSD